MDARPHLHGIGIIRTRNFTLYLYLMSKLTALPYANALPNRITPLATPLAESRWSRSDAMKAVTDAPETMAAVRPNDENISLVQQHSWESERTHN